MREIPRVVPTACLLLLHQLDSIPGAPGASSSLMFSDITDRTFDYHVTHLLFYLQHNRVVPAAICRDECVSLLRSPAAGFIAIRSMMIIEHWIDCRPGSLDCILAGEQPAITGHSVTEKALIGCFLPGLFLRQIKFALVADEFLARALDARGESDRKRR